MASTDSLLPSQQQGPARITTPRNPTLESQNPDRHLNFIQRSHEFIRWSLSILILFVHIKFVVEGLKPVSTKKGTGQNLCDDVPAADLRSIWGNINIAYPICIMLSAYGACHLVGVWVSSSDKARILEWLSLTFGFLALATVISFVGGNIFLYSLVTTGVVVALVIAQSYCKPCFRRIRACFGF